MASAHTLGTSHCATIQYRFDAPWIINTDQEFYKKLQKICPKGAASNFNTSLPNDRTPYVFDADIYVESLRGRGLLVTDTFSSAFVKLSTADVLTGNDGEIRRQCDKLNGV
ncbi:hypothetical protein MIMGU_mgv1a021416mg [Erythranthe guttata]|uniref:peroxidase n=1 Tax=Erythranthe guttata TaxID=4155 RepID=A0A022RXI1_ERYGU|nr:hypothetical protein MIMGU_mgv1a021416mg [Erythranthe guttata]